MKQLRRSGLSLGQHRELGVYLARTADTLRKLSHFVSRSYRDSEICELQFARAVDALRNIRTTMEDSAKKDVGDTMHLGLYYVEPEDRDPLAPPGWFEQIDCLANPVETTRFGLPSDAPSPAE